MRVGFDAKRITHNRTGLGNYSRFVVNGLSSFYIDNTYFLYSPREGDKQLTKLVPLSGHIYYRYPSGFNKHLSSLWRTFSIISDLKVDKIDIYHGLSNELPLRINKSAIPSIVTIHDLIFLRYPHLYNKIDRLIYSYKFKQACLQSDRIIAVSEQTKKDIISFFNIPESKINVVYQGCNKIFYQPLSNDEKEIIKNKYNLQKPYILYVGTIEERKNLLLVIKAFKELKLDVDLVIIGKMTAYGEKVFTYINENKLNSRIHRLPDVPFSHLPALYQMAELFVYPSFFEGFGIPVLEALVSNTPVIAATGSSLEEAGGFGSLYTNPNDINELRNMMEMVLQNPSLAEKMRKEGQKHAELFSEKILTNKMMDVYTSVLKEQ